MPSEDAGKVLVQGFAFHSHLLILSDAAEEPYVQIVVAQFPTTDFPCSSHNFYPS
jgi:hypothetical protein